MKLKMILLAAAMVLLTACTEGGAPENSGTEQSEPVTSSTTTEENTTTEATTTEAVTTTEEEVKEPYPEETSPAEDFKYVVSEMYYGTGINEIIITGYLGTSAEVIIPEEIEDAPVVKIADSAFQDNTLIASVTVPESVHTIGAKAFKDCTNLVTVTLYNHKSLTLGQFAFHQCESLTSINLPDYMNAIPTLAFAACTSLTEITIPKSIIFIDEAAFISCESLTTVNISEGEGIVALETIFDMAFVDCPSLQSIYIPSTVKDVGSMAFAHCKSLTDVTIADGVENIHSGAFLGCTALTGINIPAGTNLIGDCVVGYRYQEKDDGSTELVVDPDFTITCAAGSPAEKYAIENGIAYVTI